MTAAATPPLTGPRSAIPPLRFSRVLAYELRKSVSIRANRWFLALLAVTAIAAATGFYVYFMLTTSGAAPLTWAQLGRIIVDPLMTLLGCFLITLTASEWTNRSIMTTYTLVPRRGWVLSAQLIVALTYIAAFWALCLGLAALVAGLLSPSQNVDISWSTTAWDVLGVLLANVGFPLSGFLLGIAIMNTPAVVVAWVVLDWLASLLLFLLKDAGQWFHLNTALGTAVADPNTATNWAHVATSAAVWLGIPAVIGIWRSLRREAS